MEIFLKEIEIGNITIELSIQESNGSNRVVITAKDDQNRRLWRTPVLDNGEVKTYDSAEDAIEDVEKKVGLI
jgi:hypothetical protein